MKKIFVVLLLGCFAVLGAGMTIDGKLDEAEWKSARRFTNFTKLTGEKGAPLADAQSEFYVFSKDDRVYVGVKCLEPKMEELKKKVPVGIWGTDGVEIFIAPDGDTTEYYQFLITYDGYTYSLYFAEKGKIQPDPYSPDWKHAAYSGPDFWSVEAEFPLSAFYMTRQGIWNTKWRWNVARSRNVVSEHSTMAPCVIRFGEPDVWPVLDGFPMRSKADDVYISSATAKVTGMKGERPTGELVVNVELSEGAAYELCGKVFKLKEGANIVTVPYDFPGEGRNQLPIELKRLSDGKLFKRFYPVIAQYMPIDLKMEVPQYRRSFYPGQDFSKVRGTVVRVGNGDVTVTLEGSGIPRQTQILKGENTSFEFDSSKFDYGTATLAIACGKESKTYSIRRIKPNGKRMSWIENGNLVVDGKPVLRRNMYALYYNGGEAFKKRFDSDDLCITKEVIGVKGWVEPARLIKGLESKEAKKDVRPCKEYFEKLDKTIANAYATDCVYYYISDEPECRNVSPVYLQYIYEYLMEKDPYHVVLIGSRACNKYINCADWFETHPYINPRERDGVRTYDREINRLGKFLDEVTLKNRPDKCIGFMPTCFSSRSSNKAARYVTFREMVCHTWAVMIRGCKTLYPYAYHDLGDVPSLYEGTRYIFSSAKALEDIILFGKRTLLFHNEDAGAALWDYNGEQMFAVVNYSVKPVKVKLDGVKGRFMEFRGTHIFESFEFELQPHEVIVGTTKRHDAGLKTYSQVSSEIDKLDAERCNRGNLLFGHQLDVEISASKPTSRIPYKMFDGTLDVMAFNQSGKKDVYYEIAFPKPEFKPKFSKLRIYGMNLGLPVVKIRSKGSWKELQPVKTDTSEYMVDYDFGSIFSTVKIRIEFSKKRIELYEIELR